MFAYGIFKVIYSPLKTFKEIIQNPKYAGPILVMILFIVANTGLVYVAMSKTYIEQTLPTTSKLDEWTENKTFWTSNALITESGDYISGSYYGNKSIEFSIINNTQIWMQLSNIGSVNCTGVEGYKNISFRIKLIHPTTINLTSASLLLNSSSTSYFFYNLTEHLTSFNNTVWNNLTISIGPESEHWTKSAPESDWSNITGLRCQFTWTENTNVTMHFDGLFFRGVFKSLTKDATSYMFNSSLFAFMQFTIKWVFLSGLLYIISKAFGGKTVWKPLLILVGFAMITLFMQAVINAVTYATLGPTLYYPLEYFGGTKGEIAIAYANILQEVQKTWLFVQIGNYVQIAVYIWTIALCAIVLRLLVEFSWTKSLLVSTLAYFASILIENFLL